MIVFTGRGEALAIVQDWDDPGKLWVRSQDRQSLRGVIQTLKDLHPGRSYTLMRRPGWDYEFRVALTRAELAEALAERVEAIDYGKIKPTVAEARGWDHPVTKAVERVFYFLSENRPDGTKPDWLRNWRAS